MNVHSFFIHLPCENKWICFKKSETLREKLNGSDFIPIVVTI